MRFLFVDRIVELIPGKVIRGLKCITRDDYYLTSDEKGLTCFISCLMGEALGQLAAWNVMFTQDFSSRPVAGIAARATLHRQAYVGEILLLEATIDALDDAVVQYHGVVRVGEEIVFSLEGAIGPLLPMEDFIETSLVRRQFEEINRPGDWALLSQALPPQREALPYNGGLHAAPMLFDAIMEDVPGERLSAIKLITRAAPYFADHFPNKPVLPMTVLLECALNLADEFVRRACLAKAYKVQAIRRTKMSDFISPGEVIMATVTLKRKEEQQLMLMFRIDVQGKRICVFEVEMAVIA